MSTRKEELLAQIEARRDALTPAEWEEQKRKDREAIRRSKLRFAELAIVHLYDKAQPKQRRRPSIADGAMHYEVTGIVERYIDDDAALLIQLRDWARDIRQMERRYIDFREGHRKRAPKLKARTEMFREMFQDRDPDEDDQH